MAWGSSPFQQEGYICSSLALAAACGFLFASSEAALMMCTCSIPQARKHLESKGLSLRGSHYYFMTLFVVATDWALYLDQGHIHLYLEG